MITARSTFPHPLSAAGFSLVLSLVLFAGCAQRSDANRSTRGYGAAQGKAVVTAVRGHAEYAQASAPAAADGWQALFDGKSLSGWVPTDFAGNGEIEAENGQIVIRSGLMLSGVSWARTNELPATNYEVSLEAMKIDGSDFFCGLTLPSGDSHFSFIVGGWGGGVVGISSIDGMDASENDTTKFMQFDKNRWYRIRVRVTPAKIQAWIDDEEFVDQSIEGRRLSMRPGEIELSAPFGIATYQTSAALRNIRLRKLAEK